MSVKAYLDKDSPRWQTWPERFILGLAALSGPWPHPTKSTKGARTGYQVMIFVGFETQGFSVGLGSWMFMFMFMDVDFYVGVWPFHKMINHDKPWWTSGIDPLDPLSQVRARRNPPTPWRLLCRSRGKKHAVRIWKKCCHGDIYIYISRIHLNTKSAKSLCFQIWIWLATVPCLTFFQAKPCLSSLIVPLLVPSGM